MIKNTGTIRDEVWNIQDNLNSIAQEVRKEESYEGYLDEKLRKIESSVNYLRAVIDDAKKES